MTQAIKKQPSSEELSRRFRYYQEAIEPIIKYKARLMSLLPVKYILKDGEVSCSIIWSPEAKETFKRLDELIEYMQKVVNEHTDI